MIAEMRTTKAPQRRLRTQLNSDRSYFDYQFSRCPSPSLLAHNDWRAGHPYCEGVTREQIMAVMPAEIRETLELYLNGKIRDWYSRSDGRGAVFLLDTKDVAEAHTIMSSLPLAKEILLDHEYLAVAPLLPLRLLMAKP